VRNRFSLTPAARSALREILLDIAEENPDTAERVRVRFLDRFSELSRSPGTGHYHEELLDRRYRFSNLFSWVICYEWERRPIRVIGIAHGARDLEAWFGSGDGD